MNENTSTSGSVVRRSSLGLVVACLAVVLAPDAATHDVCGAAVLADFKLDHDLACPESGLTLAADGITLDLNGHTISGSGAGDGVAIVGRTDVSVIGGVIRNFHAGIRVAASSAVRIEGNQLAENREGVDCQAGCTGTAIRENEFRDNGSRGIMLRGATNGNVIKENTFTGNRVGILLFGSRNSIIKENTLSTSTLANIRVNVLASGNLIKENTAASSPTGIEIMVTPTGSASGNSIVENTLVANTCGLKGPLTGNTVGENVLLRNGSDVC